MARATASPCFASLSASLFPSAMKELEVVCERVQLKVTEVYLLTSSLMDLTYCLILGWLIAKLSNKEEPSVSFMIEAMRRCPWRLSMYTASLLAIFLPPFLNSSLETALKPSQTASISAWGERAVKNLYTSWKEERNLHHAVTSQRCRQCSIFRILGTEEYPESVSKQRSIVLNLRRRICEQHQAIISSVVDDIDVQVVFVHIVS